jgi:TetR/AcrR family transcriptional regulator, cholesterol catabolism regulator
VIKNNSDARERILIAADHLFSERGLKAVSLIDISGAVGIRHPTLYHHFPGGKEQLYLEVMKRNLKRHHQGLGWAISQVQPTIRAQLQAAAEWFLSQPPMDLMRLVYSDLPAIDPDAAQHLADLAYASLLIPVKTVFRNAQTRGEIAPDHLDLLAGAFVGMVEDLHAAPFIAPPDRGQLASYLIEVWLNGLYRK